uniref:Uncharacterized protein n=1 Tax=Pararge aegeria TaxID=116150 RepID=S4PAE0_9NEOP
MYLDYLKIYLTLINLKLFFIGHKSKNNIGLKYLSATVSRNSNRRVLVNKTVPHKQCIKHETISNKLCMAQDVTKKN